MLFPRAESSVRRFFGLTRQQRLLLLEAAVDLLRALYAVKRKPFREIAALFTGTGAQPQQIAAAGDQAQIALHVGWAIRVISRRISAHATCLVQAEAARSMLARRGLPSTLYIGVSTPKEGQDFNGHAWLRCHHIVVTGAKQSSHYRPICWFPPSESR